MAVFLGMSYEAIAAATASGPGAVKIRIFRAREQVRPCGRNPRSIPIWDSIGFGCVIYSGSILVDPTMLTRMTEEDWAVVLEVFQAVRSRRGDKGRNDRRFLEALHYFTVHNITWRALPAEFGP